MDWLTFILGIIITIFSVLYIFLKWNLSYWKIRGVTYIEPEFFWGNTKMLMKKQISLGDQITKFYNEFKSKGKIGGGVYFSISPVFLAVNTELIRNILQRDFDYFVNHGLYLNEKDDPLSAHLFNLENDRWRHLRAKLTPTFTSGKLRMMFQTIAACAEGLNEVMRNHSLIQDPVDIKEVVSRYTTDIIGSCAFGIECNSLKNPDSEFRRYGRKNFEPDTYERIKAMALMIFPRRMLHALHVKQTNEEIEKFFMNVIQKTVEYRETNSVNRKDFMHLLLQLKNAGRLSDNEDLDYKNCEPASNFEERLTMNELAAQCFVFFLAGFETSGSTMTFALLELAMNQDVQDKLRSEIVSVMDKYDGKVTYEAIKEMTYLNMVVYETLRKHPPFPALPRMCTKTYMIPGTSIVIERGTRVHIPVQSIQRDPDYYPNPDNFDPERFNEENKHKRHPFTFLAFGEGPRICIGTRFGLLQTKVGILAIIKNFRVTLNDRTKTPIKYNTKNIVTIVDGDVWLNVSEL